MLKILKNMADNRQSDSLAVKLRKKRFELFMSLISSIPRPLRILDVGGTQMFWEKMGFCEEKGVEITLFNISESKIKHPNFKNVIGDAKDMRCFKDKEFDIVFSNSMIEHVGSLDDQRRVADEIMRVGKRYYVQTPNRYFPIEPHFLFPFFQFLPTWLKAWLVMHFGIGWYKKIAKKEEAMQTVNSIRLLTRKELSNLFPGAIICKEKFLGVIKSFTAYRWE